MFDLKMSSVYSKNKELAVMFQYFWRGLHDWLCVITYHSSSLSPNFFTFFHPALLHADSYLSEEEVLDRINPFVQLVSGVVWLLRSGEVYINESFKAECTESQETGTSILSTV